MLHNCFTYSSEQLDESYAKFVRSEELIRYYETQSRETTG